MLPADKELAKWMRRSVAAPVVLAANKCERRGQGSEAGERPQCCPHSQHAGAAGQGSTEGTPWLLFCSSLCISAFVSSKTL